ncbi:ABC transporter-associated protein EcsC [Paenibacillus sp. J31TS4]|uniref:EcsC family protein n=1 Tax=Paenibacillus sp. J31TS4 TaxID=2807195 RepID=UPI001B1D7FE2|nr:EcsC family protein [Paenibacillus sp. J31TS4]GIP37245.1 ABC transporter-associated protein EcsC [Paenibacillus sp. J31TS4]
MSYEERMRMELFLWEKQLGKRPGVWKAAGETMTRRVNGLIPDKLNSIIASAFQTMIQSVLAGVSYTPKGAVRYRLTLEERDRHASELAARYKKIAAAEGAGTGAGGLVLGAVDFPALLAIKMKALFELAHLYGFNTVAYRERLFLLHVFQLAFSGTAHKRAIWQTIKDWNRTDRELDANQVAAARPIDWQKLQQEYRDTIDLRKLLQLMPGIGAVVGAWANYGLLEELFTVAKHAYHVRLLEDGDKTKPADS